MVGIVRVAEQRGELAAVVLDAASDVGLERGTVEIDATLVFGPVPFSAKPFDLVDMARDDMGDLARWQLAFAIAKRAEINQTFGATEQLGQKIVATGHDSNR